MKKNFLFLILIFLILTVAQINSKNVRIARDKVLLKDGPGNYYDTVAVLRIGTVVEYIDKSSDDPAWAQVNFNNTKGYISYLAFEEMTGNKDKFAEMDLSDMDQKKRQQIAPAAYTAAIKGFALKYSKKKGFNNKLNFDELFAITEFNRADYVKTMKETKLAYFPKEGELIGVKEGYINDRMMALGLSASLKVLQQGVVMDEQMTKKMNVIANILIRQTWDFDSRYRVWIIKDEEPTAFSGPGGYIFLSDKLVSMLSDYREMVAIIAHEIGHVALRHGIHDAAIAMVRQKQKKAFEELEKDQTGDDLEETSEMEETIDQAVKSITLVRDNREEFQADQISVELLNRYKINKKYLISALGKMYLALNGKYPEYKKQLFSRIARLKGENEN